VGNRTIVHKTAECPAIRHGHECLDCIREIRMELADGTLKKMPRKRKIATRAGQPKRCGEHMRAKRARDSVRRSVKHVLETHGVTAEEYDAVYEAQGRKCWFPRCRATGERRRLAVDHDHAMAVTETPEHPKAHNPKHACRYCFRGLLCLGHNTYLLGWYVHDLQDGLGYLADPPARKVLQDA
jgi:hypothetical protein